MVEFYVIYRVLKFRYDDLRLFPLQACIIQNLTSYTNCFFIEKPLHLSAVDTTHPNCHFSLIFAKLSSLQDSNMLVLCTSNTIYNLFCFLNYFHLHTVYERT
jgi:hypothetical protein